MVFYVFFYKLTDHLFYNMMHVFARRTLWYPVNFPQNFVNLEKESIKSGADARLCWKDIMWYSPNSLPNVVNFKKEKYKGIQE